MNCHMLKYKTEKMIKYSHILKTSFAITDYIILSLALYLLCILQVLYL